MMRLNHLKTAATALLLVFLSSSCSHIKFDLPPGPKGDNGESSYELWRKEVQEGHLKWPKEQVSLSDFMRYIKGPKGDQGINGSSAYQLWKDYIASGNIEDPHSKGKMWDPLRNSEVDFWDFLTGHDGLTPYIGPNNHWFIGETDTNVKALAVDGVSAYDQWKEDVIRGLITDKNGDLWTKEDIDVNDFYRYLKGKNGANGLSPHIGDNGHWIIGNTDTGIFAKGEKGEKGEKGDTGFSAYDLWKKDVLAGKIMDKNGHVWNKDLNSYHDFYTYLMGSNGLSAYELWKKRAESGLLDNPKNTSVKWDNKKTSVADFYDFLTGKDGKNGKDGKSAYELWKEDLAAKCGTSEALIDQNTGKPWDCTRNTEKDFFSYLTGKEGAPGADGRPGTPGEKGTEVKIILGKPNVIASYSQSEYSEYVRPSDGGVQYTVYDSEGNKAPGAIVKGLPGIDPDKTYTADDNAQFLVPREDLPFTDDLNQRFGSTKEVTVVGKGTMASAVNTYVPNKVQVRMVNRASVSLDSRIICYLKVQRKISPSADWTDYPSYLPRFRDNFRAVKIRDKNDPNSITSEVYGNLNSYSIGTDATLNFYINRPMVENPYGEKNNAPNYWDGRETYFTILSEGKLYGEPLIWRGSCEYIPYIMGPTLKSVKLSGFHHSEDPYFDNASGEFDFSKVDSRYIYTNVNEEEGPDGMYIYSGEKMSEADFNTLKSVYINFKYDSSLGTQTSSSNDNKSSVSNPSYGVLTPYLNSYISVVPSSSKYFKTSTYTGTLKQKGTQLEFYIDWRNYDGKLPKVNVTYVP